MTERGDEGVARIKDLTKGVGADSVLECVGTQESMMQAIRSTRPGGYVSYVGVPHGVELEGEELFFTHVHLHGGPAPVRRYLPQLISLVLEGKIDPGKVFDLTLPLDRVAEGYRAMDERRAIKTLLARNQVTTGQRENGFKRERTMPHVIVKLWPGKSEQQKSSTCSSDHQKCYGHSPLRGRVGFGREVEEVKSEDWAEKVYKPDIQNKWDTLYKKPGYDGERAIEERRNGNQKSWLATSAKGPSEWFTGTVRIDLLFQAPDPALVQGASVTFEPGARTAWHTHPLGQTLIVTAGCGWAQRGRRAHRGDPAR